MCKVMSNSFSTPWTVVGQAPLSIGFPRQEYWNELPFPPPRDLPNPEMETVSPVSTALQANSLLLSHWGRDQDIQVVGNYKALM